MMKRLATLCIFCASALVSLVSCSRETPVDGFYQAVDDWNVSDIRDELVDGADVNMRFADHDNMTPLMVAARAHHPEAVRYLLHAGADVAAVDANGLTALDYAERSRSMKGRALLLAAGATSTRRNGLIQQYASAPAPSIHEDRKFQVEGRPLAERVKKYSLGKACQWADVEVVEYHLKHGADVNTPDEDGLTPLMEAVGSICSTKASEWIVARLLAAGADVNAVDKQGHNVLYHATQYPHAPSDLVPMLLEAGIGLEGGTDADWYTGRIDSIKIDNLHRACELGDLEAARRFLAEGADVNGLEADRTPLMEAVSYQTNLVDREKLVALLLEAGADVNAKNGDGESVLFLAVESGYKHNGIVPMLLEAGADATIRTNDNRSVLNALPHYVDSSSGERRRAQRVTTLLEQHGAPDGAIMGFMSSVNARHARGLKKFSLEEGVGRALGDMH